MLAESWRAICLRGIYYDRHSRLPCWGSLIRTARLSHFAPFQSPLREISDFQQSLCSLSPRHTVYSIRKLSSDSYRASAASRRRRRGRSQENSTWSARSPGAAPETKKNGVQWIKRGSNMKGSTKRSTPITSNGASFSGQSVLNRPRLSWVDSRRARKRRLVTARSNVGWRIISFVKKRNLSDDIRSKYSPQIWSLVAEASPRWFSDSEHIFEAIVREGNHPLAAVPNGLLQFQRFVDPSSTTSSNDGAIYRAWMARSWRGKAIWWRHALHYALLNSPMDALRIMADISKRPHLQIPGKIIADALLFFDAHCVANDVFTQSNYEQIVPFYETACLYLQQYTKREGSASLSWCIIRRLSRALDTKRLRRLVECVTASKTEYNIYTKLHTMHRYLELNHLSHALDLFSTFTKEELLNRAAQSFCVTILRLPWQVEDLSAFRRQLTLFLLEKGLQPDCTVRNVILQNYLESGDRYSAWRMLDAIRNNKLRTSEHTYALFLKHTSLEDSQSINALYNMAVEDKVLHRSSFLAGYFIQVAASGRFASGENSFEALLDLYRSFFSMTDLEELGIVERSEETPQSIMVPSSFAVQWMLMSWIHENRKNPDKLLAVYNNYQFHLRNNHPRISLLASAGYLGTSFVLAFGQHKSHLYMCTKVLQDMIQPDKPIPPPPTETDPDLPDYEKFLEPEDPSDTISSPHEQQHPTLQSHADLDSELAHITSIQRSLRKNPFAYKVAAPGSWTWNSLLSVLLKHNAFDSAESVVKAMQRAGFQPDNITWKILVRGFVNRHVPAQIHPVVEELRKNAALRPDRATIDALAHPEPTMPLPPPVTLLERFKANLEKQKHEQSQNSDGAGDRIRGTQADADADWDSDDANEMRIPSWSELEQRELEREREKDAPLDEWGVAAEMEARL